MAQEESPKTFEEKKEEHCIYYENHQNHQNHKNHQIYPLWYFPSNNFDIEKFLADYEKIQQGIKKIHESTNLPKIVPPEEKSKPSDNSSNLPEIVPSNESSSLPRKNTLSDDN